MVKILDCCNNLNSGSQSQESSLEGLTEDSTFTVEVTELGTILVWGDEERRLIKIYVAEVLPSAEVWIRYGEGISLDIAAHPLPSKHLLLINSLQVRGAISAITSSGTAQLRVSVANRI